MSLKRNTYWMQAALWLGFVYGSIPLVRPVCEALRHATPFNALVNILIVGIITAFFVVFVQRRKIDLINYILIGCAFSIYIAGLYIVRIPEERIHFIQYGVLAILIIRAMRVDIKGVRVYLLALILTSLLGWIDEGIQHMTPGRYYDNKDVILNCVSGAMGLFLDVIYNRSRQGSYGRRI